MSLIIFTLLKLSIHVLSLAFFIFLKGLGLQSYLQKTKEAADFHSSQIASRQDRLIKQVGLDAFPEGFRKKSYSHTDPLWIRLEPTVL